MKLRTMITILIAILAMTIFTGCGQSESVAPEAAVAAIPTERTLEIIPDTTLDYHEHNVQFYNYGNTGESEVIISDESVPLVSAPEGSAVTKRQAEAIAIAYSGFDQDSIAFLHTKYVDEDADASYFHISFQNDGINYVIHIDEATGAVIAQN